MVCMLFINGYQNFAFGQQGKYMHPSETVPPSTVFFVQHVSWLSLSRCHHWFCFHGYLGFIIHRLF